MAAIATKDIGINPENGLNQRINVWQITIDSKAEVVIVVYNIETLSPNGVVVTTSENKTYTRSNNPETDTTEANMKYDSLRESTVGQMIKGMIDLNLSIIKSISDLGKLEQDVILKEK